MASPKEQPFYIPAPPIFPAGAALEDTAAAAVDRASAAGTTVAQTASDLTCACLLCCLVAAYHRMCTSIGCPAALSAWGCMWLRPELWCEAGWATLGAVPAQLLPPTPPLCAPCLLPAIDLLPGLPSYIAFHISLVH